MNDRLSVGQLRRQTRLGTEAVYRVQSWDAELVTVEVVEAPGLRPGDTFRFSAAAVLAMEVADSSARAETSVSDACESGGLASPEARLSS